MRHAETGSLEWLEGSESVCQASQTDHFNARETPMGFQVQLIRIPSRFLTPSGIGLT